MKIGLFAAQLVLPAVPGLYVILFRPGVSLLTPRMLIPSMLCINLLALLLGWRRLGWSRNERLDAAMLLVMFALFPWLEYRVLPVGAFGGEFVGAGRVLLRGTGDRVCLGRAGARLVGKAQTAAL